MRASLYRVREQLLQPFRRRRRGLLTSQKEKGTESEYSNELVHSYMRKNSVGAKA